MPGLPTKINILLMVVEDAAVAPWSLDTAAIVVIDVTHCSIQLLISLTFLGATQSDLESTGAYLSTHKDIREASNDAVDDNEGGNLFEENGRDKATGGIFLRLMVFVGTTISCPLVWWLVFPFLSMAFLARKAIVLDERCGRCGCCRVDCSLTLLSPSSSPSYHLSTFGVCCCEETSRRGLRREEDGSCFAISSSLIIVLKLLRVPVTIAGT